MGKVDENKKIKLNALFQSAYDLFLKQGIDKTSIHDIVKNAGVAKGTFYLYFKDKYEVRDHLIAKSAKKLFLAAHDALNDSSITEFDEKIIFMVNYVLDEMQKNPLLLRFISKNLSWGLFQKAIVKTENDPDVLTALCHMIDETPSVKLKNPDLMLFMIVELASAASYSCILEKEPVSFEELRPYLNNSIRAIIQTYIEEDSETDSVEISE